MDDRKIVVLTGAGVSAESGIQTFRDAGGLWDQVSVAQVATPAAWKNNPARVLEFYNKRRRVAGAAAPNAAHAAIAALEQRYEVVVITQNIDNLHERAGSKRVIHLHGEISKARSTVDESLVYEIGDRDLSMGDLCEKGSQLRPHVVWFGEKVLEYDECVEPLRTAGRVLVVGTSLSVVPAARLLRKARGRAEKVLVALEVEKKPYGYRFIREKATAVVPGIVDDWLAGRRASGAGVT